MNPDIMNALWGNAGLTGVQWTLLDPAPNEVLRRALVELLPSADLLGNCHLHRAKYKPGRYLLAYYDVEICNQGAEPSAIHPIEVTWTPVEAEDPRGAMPALLQMQAEALQQQNRPAPPAPVYAIGSLEWQRQQEEAKQAR